MTSIELNLPVELVNILQTMADRQGISIQAVIIEILARHVESYEEYERRENRAILKEILSQVPDVEPEDYDKL